MRIAMLVVRTRREQPAGLAQVRADRPIGRVELGIDDRALSAEPAPVGAVLAVAFHGELRLQPVRLAQLEIVLAVVRGHMDQPGAALGGDEVAGQEWAGFGKEPAEVVHRVAGDGSGEVGALAGPHRREAELSACRCLGALDEGAQQALRDKHLAMRERCL
jgi:hypothetical protein